MRDESWHKWFFIAIFFHVLIIGAFSVPIRGGHKQIDLSSYYSVNLVGEIGGQTPKTAAPSMPAQAQKQAPAPKKAETKKAKQLPPQHPQSTTKERSLAPVKKQAAPRSTTKDDVRWLDKRIREMKNDDTTSIDEKIRQMRKQYMDVSSASKSRGSGLPASGGSTPLDPTLGKYYNDVWGIIQTPGTPLFLQRKIL